MKKVLMFNVTICLMLIASIAWSNIIHIPGDYPTIQAGIDAVKDGDTVLVADGTYKGDGNKNLDFAGKAITVKSENGAEYCIIHCEGDGRGFYFHSGETSEAVVCGFTITNGLSEYGGGINCENSSPTIKYNKIIKNSATWGAGICCNNSSPVISNNIIAENAAGDSGGGIRCLSSSALIEKNNIVKNSATYGGGVYEDNSSPTITNNFIAENFVTKEGAGVHCYKLFPIITNNKIINNSSEFIGGGILCNQSYPTITNNIIANNSAEGGGGIYIWSFSNPIIANNTICKNRGGGIFCCNNVSAIVLNSILWADSPCEIFVGVSSTITVVYSDIQGGFRGEGNIDADPMFVDADNGDYRLSDYSPCIGVGIQVSSVPGTDIEENPRPNPPGSDLDIGAYENFRHIGEISADDNITAYDTYIASVLRIRTLPLAFVMRRICNTLDLLYFYLAGYVAPVASTLSVPPVATSVEGRRIHCFVYGRGPETILIVGGIHGNEPAGSELAKQLCVYLESDTELLAARRVVVVPAANPDGLSRNQRTNAHEVNLQYDFLTRNWEPTTYYDIKLFPEPETQFIATLIQQYHPDRIVQIHQARFFSCIDWDGPARNLANAMAQACELPLRKLGAVRGSLGSYAGVDRCIPTITMELPASDTQLPPEALWQRYGSALLVAIRNR